MATIFTVNKPRKFHRESYFHDERKERLEARVRKVKRDTAAALFARYEGDVEDHQILLTLIYEVI